MLTDTQQPSVSPLASTVLRSLQRKKACFHFNFKMWALKIIIIFPIIKRSERKSETMWGSCLMGDAGQGSRGSCGSESKDCSLPIWRVWPHLFFLAWMQNQWLASSKHLHLTCRANVMLYLLSISDRSNTLTGGHNTDMLWCRFCR